MVNFKKQEDEQEERAGEGDGRPGIDRHRVLESKCLESNLDSKRGMPRLYRNCSGRILKSRF